MPRPVAALLLAATLGAQDPAASRPPIRVIALQVDIPASNRPAADLGTQQVVDDLIAFFTRNGILILPESDLAEAGDAYTLEVSPITVQYGEGTCLLSVSERLVHLPAPGKAQEAAPQAWARNYMVAQAGEEGLRFQARQVVLGMAARLVREARGEEAPGLAIPALSIPPQADATQRPSPERPKAVEVDVSRVKVRTRPPTPPYPTVSENQQTEGTVVVQITVDPEGRPSRALAVSGPTELKPTALRYAMQWVFEPTRVDGQAQWARFDLTLAFRLHENRPPQDPPKRP